MIHIKKFSFLCLKTFIGTDSLQFCFSVIFKDTGWNDYYIKHFMKMYAVTTNTRNLLWVTIEYNRIIYRNINKNNYLSRIYKYQQILDKICIKCAICMHLLKISSFCWIIQRIDNCVCIEFACNRKINEKKNNNKEIKNILLNTRVFLGNE